MYSRQPSSDRAPRPETPQLSSTIKFYRQIKVLRGNGCNQNTAAVCKGWQGAPAGTRAVCSGRRRGSGHSRGRTRTPPTDPSPAASPRGLLPAAGVLVDGFRLGIAEQRNSFWCRRGPVEDHRKEKIYSDTAELISCHRVSCSKSPELGDGVKPQQAHLGLLD